MAQRATTDPGLANKKSWSDNETRNMACLGRFEVERTYGFVDVRFESQRLPRCYDSKFDLSALHAASIADRNIGIIIRTANSNDVSFNIPSRRLSLAATKSCHGHVDSAPLTLHTLAWPTCCRKQPMKPKIVASDLQSSVSPAS